MVAALSDYKAVILVATEKKRAFTGLRRDVRLKCGAQTQGFASISSISSSLVSKRPSSDSMTGLAI
jgi:hypothetical protein